jgi:hypothetical protein
VAVLSKLAYVYQAIVLELDVVALTNATLLLQVQDVSGSQKASGGGESAKKYFFLF